MEIYFFWVLDPCVCRVWKEPLDEADPPSVPMRLRLRVPFPCFELPLFVTQAADRAHRRSRNPAVQDSVEHRMKLNGRPVRNHLVAEAQLVFMKAAGRA